MKLGYICMKKIEIELTPSDEKEWKEVDIVEKTRWKKKKITL